MKLRIPRRIKVEEDSSDSENDEATTSAPALEPPNDKVPVVTTKAATVSPASANNYREVMKSESRRTVFKVDAM